MSQLVQGSIAETLEPAAGLRILVIDDNQDSADSLAMMLQMIGHEVRSATDGMAGLETAKVFRPEVMFLDIRMPGISGYDIARLVRGQQWGERVSLVALTGWGQDDDVSRAREAGFNHHLVKPVGLDAVLSLLSSTARYGSQAVEPVQSEPAAYS
jgi:DNA-binding response OmpR family regulator